MLGGDGFRFRNRCSRSRRVTMGAESPFPRALSVTARRGLGASTLLAWVAASDGNISSAQHQLLREFAEAVHTPNILEIALSAVHELGVDDLMAACEAVRNPSHTDELLPVFACQKQPRCGHDLPHYRTCLRSASPAGIGRLVRHRHVLRSAVCTSLRDATLSEESLDYRFVGDRPTSCAHLVWLPGCSTSPPRWRLFA